MTSPGGQSFGDPGSAQRTATVTLNADVGSYSSQMAQAAQQTNMMSASVTTLSQKLGHLDKWVGRKLFGFAAADAAGLAGMAADAATFEKQMSTLSATVAITGGSMKNLKSGIESAFTAFPVARGHVIELVETITDLGVTSDRQIASLTRTFIKLGAATGESATGLASGLVQLSRLMGVTDAGQIGNMANSLLTVSKNAGVSASGVLSFAQGIAPMARQAGIGEAAVLGISTAFSKAGADGFVAANSFNSMLGDMTQLVSTGSPDIAKYANLIGVTAEQFAKMDKGTAFTKIVTELNNMGPKAVAVLDQLGLSGVRAQRAFAALAQSGDLQRQMEIAIGSQGDQSNLNKGASAAFNNLADSLAKTRNRFTELGTIIGTTFLGPLTIATKAVGSFAGMLTRVFAPVSGLIGGVAAGVGGMAAVGGVAMNAAGLIGSVALMRMVTRGTHVASFRGGFNAQRTGGENLSPADAKSMELYTAGQMSRMQRAIYQGGMGVARGIGAPDRLAALSTRDRDAYGRLQAKEMSRPERRAYLMGAQYGRAVPVDWASRTDEERNQQRHEMARMSPEERSAYRSGQAYGRLPHAELTNWRTWRNLGLAAGPRAIQALNAGQAQMLRESTRSSWDRLTYRDQQPRMRLADRFTRMVNQTAGLRPFDVVGQEVNRTVRSGGDLANAYTNAAVSQAGPVAARVLRYAGPRLLTSLVAGYSGVSFAGTMANRVRSTAGPEDMEAVSRRVSTNAVLLGAAIRHPIAGFGVLGKQSLSTAGALKDLGLKATGTALGALGRGAGTAISQVSSSLWTGFKGLAGMAFSLPGLAAMSAFQWVKGRMDKGEHAGDVDKFLNPIQKYNEALGTTTTNLANFNQALLTGASAAGVAVSMKDAAKVGTGDEAAAPNKAKNTFWGDIKKNANKADRTEALAGALATLPISDGKQLQAAKLDMLAGGISKEDVQKALDLYMARGGPNAVSGLGDLSRIGYLGQAVANSEGKGYNIGGDMSKSQSGGHIMGTMISGIDSQRISDEEKYGAVYARQRAFGSYEAGLAPLVDRAAHTSGGARLATSKAIADAVGKITGGDTDTIRDYVLGHDQPGKGVKAQQEYVAKIFQSTSQGRKYMKSFLTKGGTIDPDAMNNALVDMANSPDGGSFNGLLRKRGGALGRFAAGNQDVQQAIGVKQESPGAVRGSVELLLGRAVELGQGFVGAGRELSRFQGAIGDSTSALYKQVSAAIALADKAAEYRMPFQSRGQNFSQAIQQYKDASDVLYSTPKDQRTDEMISRYDQKKTGYEQALAEQQAYQNQIRMTAQSFGIQMKRGEEDNAYQRGIVWRNFRIQQQDAQQDYNRSVLRSEQDHARQLANQAKQTAQSIYDPYARLQNAWTLDAGTVLQNLGDQNERLFAQRANLTKVKGMGLSTEAIQELNLADPTNALQLEQLIQTSLGDPKVLERINREVHKRIKNTTALTQNPFVLSFQQGEQEYHIQLQHGQQDYQIATARALRQHNLALGDMATQYNKTIKRAGEDLTLTMKEITGTFAQMNTGAWKQIADSVEKYSPKAAAQMRTDLKDLTKDFPFLLKGDASTYDPRNSNSKYTTTPGIRGLNQAGQYGYYDAKGVFHEQAGPPKQDSPLIAPPKGYAAGGVSFGPQLAMVSEWSANAAELHLPLTGRGQQAMAGFTRDVVQRLLTSGRGSLPTGNAGGSYQYHDDHSTRFSGDIHISAADYADLMRQIEAKKRLNRLSSPARA